MAAEETATARPIRIRELDLRDPRNTTIAVPMALHRKFRRHCRRKREHQRAALIRLITAEITQSASAR